jgi:N-acyl amino acid synthase of PEP-CTERM/exosortase system
MFDSRYELYLADTTESRALHHRVRYQVFCVERGFEQAEAFNDYQELDRWDAHSHHFVVQDRESGAGVAAMRIVLPTAHRQLPVEDLGCITSPPTVIDGRHEVAEVSRICMVRDVTSSGQHLGVQAVSRGEESEVLWGLIRAIYRYTLDQEIPHLYMLVTRPFARLLKHLGMDCIQVGEAIEHRGLRVPYLVDVNASWERVAARSGKLAELFARHYLAYLSHAEMQAPRLPLKAAGDRQFRPQQAAA